MTLSVKERVALISLVTTIAITLAKGFAGWSTGSLALISDALQSLFDVAVTAFTLYVVHQADKPADDEHTYGHGKFESLAALVETIVLCLLAGAIAFEGVRRLIAGVEPVTVTPVVFLVLAVSIAVDLWRWIALSRVARETRSEALAADALHFAADLVNSVCVIVALIFVAQGYPQADAIAAIGVAGFIAVAAYTLGRRTIDGLIDTAPRGAVEALRREIRSIPGVEGVSFVRLRPSGGALIGEIGIKVARMQSLEHLAAIKEAMRERIDKTYPGTDVTIAAEPLSLSDESMLERVLFIAARRRVPVHHVMVHEVDGDRALSLDIEVDGRLSLRAAHAIATRLEKALAAELGRDLRIVTHIEPLEARLVEGSPVSDADATSVRHKLVELVDASPQLSDAHALRTCETASGWLVHFHCRGDPKLSVAEAHLAVDEVERGLRQAFPRIVRVVGHVEPPRRAPATFLPDPLQGARRDRTFKGF